MNACWAIMFFLCESVVRYECCVIHRDCAEPFHMFLRRSEPAWDINESGLQNIFQNRAANSENRAAGSRNRAASSRNGAKTMSLSVLI